MTSPSRSAVRRRGFSLVELIFSVVLIALLASTAAVSTGAVVPRIKQAAEADRLVNALRWARQLAIARGPNWSFGYGVYFWSNRVSRTCIQYSPYSPVMWRCADDPRNTIYSIFNGAGPRTPVNVGVPQSVEYRADMADVPGLTAAYVTNGLEIVFQTDVPGRPDYRPVSLPSYPLSTTGYDRDRVVFWPPGVRAPVRLGAPWPAEYGVTLPMLGNVIYNRIYLRSKSDAPASWNTEARVPARIQIHPGTGAVRLMGKNEV